MVRSNPVQLYNRVTKRPQIFGNCENLPKRLLYLGHCRDSYAYDIHGRERIDQLAQVGALRTPQRDVHAVPEAYRQSNGWLDRKEAQRRATTHRPCRVDAAVWTPYDLYLGFTRIE